MIQIPCQAAPRRRRRTRAMLVFAVALCMTSAAGPAGAAASDWVPSLFKKKEKPEPKLVIPDFPTAAEQFQFAMLYKSNQMTAPDVRRRRKQSGNRITCFGRVVERFPDDTKVTPLAKLEIADLRRGIGQYDAAEALYRDVIAKNGADDYFHVRALYSIARGFSQKFMHQKAKDIFREVFEKFPDNRNPMVAEIVDKARSYYLEVKVEGKGTATPRPRGSTRPLPF